MASAAPDHHAPRKRSRSLDLPPHLSELRVILLGSTWAERREVENFIMEENKSNTENEPGFQTVRRQLQASEIVLINTPDLPPVNTSQHTVTEFVKECARCSDPGPHVFLVLLQPEDFTKEQNERICKILEKYSDQSFDHSLILISAPRKNSLALEDFIKKPLSKDLIRKCKYRYLRRSDIERSELLTRLGQIVKENNEDYLTYEAFKGLKRSLPGDHQSPKQKKRKSSITGAVGAAVSEFKKERHEKLQKEFEQEREKSEKKQKEDQLRREQEEKEKKVLEENYRSKMGDMEKKYEDEARKQAEEFNEFRAKYKHFEALMDHEKLKALKEQHDKEMQQKQEAHREEYNRLQELSSYKEKQLKEEMKQKEKLLKEEMERKQKQLREEMNEKRKLKKEMERKEKALKEEIEIKEQELKDEMERKQKQLREEMNEKSKVQQEMKELKKEHEKQINDLKEELKKKCTIL